LIDPNSAKYHIAFSTSAATIWNRAEGEEEGMRAKETVKFGVDHGINNSILNHNLNDITKSALLADSLNYDSVWMNDHINWVPVNSQIANNWILLSSLVPNLKNRTIGILVSDPHRYHPAVLTQMHATMDHLTDGRFVLGVGAGEGANLNQYHIPWNKPYSRLKEAVELMRSLWDANSTKPANYDGDFYQMSNAFLQMKFLKSPQLWIAGNGPRTRDLTAKYGTGWFPTATTPKLYSRWASEIDKQAESYGRSREDIEHAYQIYVNIAKDKKSVSAFMKQAMCNFVTRKEIADEYGLKPPEGIEMDKSALMEIPRKLLKVMEFSKQVPDSLADEMCAYGTSEDVISRFESFIGAGVDHFVIMFLGGNYFDQLKIFADKILPYFRGK
jgi:phthiodiolone/phenolphthiodiolone dimycocerosates ketoreductase